VDDVWSDASPDGGIYASMSDLLRFITAFYNGNLPSGINYPQRPLAGGSNYWNTVVVPFADGTMVLIMSNLGEIADALARRVYAIGNGQTPEPLKKTNEMQLYDEWKTNGINYVEANIQNIVKQFDLPYDSRFLNYFGYRFLKGGDTEAALQFFQLNTKLFPKEANTYDSLAEAWLAKGDKGKAIQYYNKALEVDPQFKNAKKMLAQLSEK
jgi:tetratricopeptide (TPR) repeat protein